MRRDEVSDRVAAELLAGRTGELEGDRRLGHDRQRLDCGDVAALDERLRRLAGLQVDRLRAAASASAAASSRRGRRSPRRSRRRPRCRRRGSSRGRARARREDLVVGGRAALAGEREAVADLDALHGLDAHQRRGEASVQPVLLRRVRAEARRNAARAHLDDAADRVAIRLRLVDVRPSRARRAGDLDSDLARAAPSPPRPPRP